MTSTEKEDSIVETDVVDLDKITSETDDEPQKPRKCCTNCPNFPLCIGYFDLVLSALTIILLVVLIFIRISVMHCWGIFINIFGMIAGWKLIQSRNKDFPNEERRKLAQFWKYFNMIYVILYVLTFIILIFVLFVFVDLPQWLLPLDFDLTEEDQSIKSEESKDKIVLTLKIMFCIVVIFITMITFGVRFLFHRSVGEYIKTL